MKIMITGGSGFIGQHVTEALLNSGLDVRIYDLKASAHTRVEFIEGNVLEPERLEIALQGCDAIVHLAAQVSVQHSINNPEQTHLDNVVGTQNVLSCAAKLNIKRIIVASSAAVYGDSSELPLEEHAIGTLQSPYAHSKAENERQVLEARQFGSEAVALRFFNVYGPKQLATSAYSAVIPSMVNCIVEGRQPVVHGDGRQTRDFVHVRDVANSIQTILRIDWGKVQSHVYNVGSQSQLSIIELIDIISEQCLNIGVIDTVLPPTFTDKRGGDIQHSMASISQIHAHIGWKPTIDIHQGILELITNKRAKK